MSFTLPQMTPIAFIRQLPEVQDVTDDDECHICTEKYRPAKAPAPGIVESLYSMVVRREPESTETERAVRLPCQHVLGRRCLKIWFSANEGYHNTCPYVSALS